MDLDVQLPEDYSPSDGEIDNITYLTCKYACGWPMRQADLAVCKRMTGEIRGSAGISKYVETVCEYLWDHICGEPEEVSAEDFFKHMKPMLESWYSQTTPEDRSKTE